MRIEARDLCSTTTEVLHCGEPMRYVKSLTTWSGKHGSGTENETVTRACACGATLTMTMSVPS